MAESVSTTKNSNAIVTLHNNHTIIEYNCQKFDIPGFDIGSTKVSNHIQALQLAGDTIQFNPLNISVIIDKDLKVLKEIFNTLLGFKDYETTGKIRPNQDVYDITIDLLSNKNNPIMKIKLVGARFKSFSGLTYDVTSTEDLIANLTFIYQYPKILL